MRTARYRHRGAVIWLTGLSGAGKSTLAVSLEQRLFSVGAQAYVLDGDNIRRGLNTDLGFSPEDRGENIRRVGEAAALFADAGIVAIAAFISPYKADRARARAAAERLVSAGFDEGHVGATLEICERRDPKGLYRKARAGKIADFTGVSAPSEPPENPELLVDTGILSMEASIAALMTYVLSAIDLRTP